MGVEVPLILKSVPVNPVKVFVVAYVGTELIELHVQTVIQYEIILKVLPLTGQ